MKNKWKIILHRIVRFPRPDSTCIRLCWDLFKRQWHQRYNLYGPTKLNTTVYYNNEVGEMTEFNGYLSLKYYKCMTSRENGCHGGEHNYWNGPGTNILKLCNSIMIELEYKVDRLIDMYDYLVPDIFTYSYVWFYIRIFNIYDFTSTYSIFMVLHPHTLTLMPSLLRLNSLKQFHPMSYVRVHDDLIYS